MASLRALLSLIMLAGFYVVGLVQLALVGVFAFWLVTVIGTPMALKPAVPLVAALVGGAGVALWRAIRARNEPMAGVTVSPDQAPQLWGEVRGLAQAVGTRAPEEIRIVGDVNAAVSEQARLLGLIGGRRYLYLGLPLLTALTVDQFRAVVAHELGHYSGADTRFAGAAYRGRLAIMGTLSRIGRANPVGWVFGAYSRLYLLVDNAASRRQELQADVAAVRVAGKRAVLAALTEASVAVTAYQFYLEQYITPGTEFGLLPSNVFAGFGELLEARCEEIDQLRAEAPEIGRASLWNTHPPLGQRLIAIGALADVDRAGDARRATDLLTDTERLGRDLQLIVIQQTGREVVPWDDFASAIATRRLQAQADSVLRDISRKLNQPGCGLPQVLSALHEGRAGELGEVFFPDATREEAAGKFARPLTMLLELAALRSSRAGWLTSWTEPAELLGLDGDPLELAGVARLAVDPATLPQAKARLAQLGVDVEAAPMVEKVASARGAQVIAGLSNAEFGGLEVDLFVLDHGLVAVRTREEDTKGRKRMRAMLERVSAQELAKAHQFVAFEDLKRVTISNNIPLRATIELHDGKTFELKESWGGYELHRSSRKVLADIFKHYEP